MSEPKHPVGPLAGLWAKSPPRGAAAGEPLTVHLEDTLRAADAVARRIGRLVCVDERFWTWVAWAALTHDAGKVAAGFQRSLRERGPAGAWGERHEVLSLGFLPSLLARSADDELRWIALGVAAHHRPFFAGDDDGRRSLAQRYPMNMPGEELAERVGHLDADAAAELHAWLAHAAYEAGLSSAARSDVPDPDTVVREAHRLLGELLDRWERPASGDDGFTGTLMQAAVTMADHLSSAHGWLHESQPLGPGYRTQLEGRLDASGSVLLSHQRAASEVRGHLLLRAPTGSGKTEAALLWAAAQAEDLSRETGGVPRVFYTLPYLASINAMAERLGTEVDAPDGVGVAHSRAASYHLARSVADETDFDPADDGRRDRQLVSRALERAAATKLFRETVRVGTPYQLLRGTLGGPVHSSVLLDTANSVFVLDELHAYEPRRLGMILGMLGLWVRLGGRVAVLSATLPDALADLLRGVLGTDVCEVEARYANWPARHRVRVDTGHLTDVDSVRDIEGRIRDGHAVLVVANNIADAQRLYASLSPVARDLHGDAAAVLLHGRFKRGDRSRIERRIRERFSTGRPPAPGLLIATQVVEVSLDVDFDVVHSSAAPLEALAQRWGRVNRLGRGGLADVVVHAPAYGDRGHGRDRADGVYDREPTELAWDILRRHDGQPVDERALTDWLNTVYRGDWGTEWREQVEKQRTKFEQVFLGFSEPFTDRSILEREFEKMFDGMEAVLSEDVDAYRAVLAEEGRAPGRLLAEEHLVPLPTYAHGLARWNTELRVGVVDGTYDPELGLTRVKPHRTGAEYAPGVLI